MDNKETILYSLMFLAGVLILAFISNVVTSKQKVCPKNCVDNICYTKQSKGKKTDKMCSSDIDCMDCMSLERNGSKNKMLPINRLINGLNKKIKKINKVIVKRNDGVPMETSNYYPPFGNDEKNQVQPQKQSTRPQ
jgi:hypothetical protein